MIFPATDGFPSGPADPGPLLPQPLKLLLLEVLCLKDFQLLGDTGDMGDTLCLLWFNMV